MKISHVSFGELLKNKKFSTAYSKVLQQQSLTNKTVMEEQYQFTIANKPVKVIETESATSYTILINRAIDDVNSFENLIVQQLNSGETTANIIKYVPFQPATIESYFLNGDFNGNRTITPIVYNDNLISTNKDSNNCSTVCTTLCYVCSPNSSVEFQTPHTPTKYCINMYANIQTTCEEICIPSYSGGGDSSSNPIDLTGGGGTGGTTGGVETPPNNTGNNNPIVTAPVLELEEENETPVVQIPPCEKLKNLLKKPKPDIKSTIINNLIPNIGINPYGEKAAYLQKSPDGTMGTTISLPTTKGQIGIRTGGNYYSAIHTHPESAYPMFSWSDVYTLYTLNKQMQAHNAGLSSFLLVCKDQNGDFQTYAIMIENIENTIESVLNDPKYAGKKVEDIKAIMDSNLFKDYYIEQNNQTSTNYDKAFLKFMKDSNISLYKADNTLTTWSKLSLDESQTNLNNPEPCN